MCEELVLGTMAGGVFLLALADFGNRVAGLGLELILSIEW